MLRRSYKCKRLLGRGRRLWKIKEEAAELGRESLRSQCRSDEVSATSVRSFGAHYTEGARPALTMLCHWLGAAGRVQPQLETTKLGWTPDVLY